VSVSVGVTVKPKRFLPFLLFQSKRLPHPGPRSQSLAFTFCLLLTPYCLLLLTSCKDVGVLPNRILGPDTTSHNFIWQIDTLGDGNSSVLNDVFIIDENNIWAVGEIYLKDTSGQFDSNAYGFAVWDGAKWNLRRHTAVGPTGNISNLRPRGVFAFSSTDVWFASGGVFHWNGQTVTSYWINDFPGNPSPILSPGQTAEGIWGASSSDLYAVGLAGAMAHFDGILWQKRESGTTLPLNDIWGTKDLSSGIGEILCVASNKYLDEGKKVLRITGSTVTSIADTGLSWGISGVWFTMSGPYYVVGAGVGRKSILDTTSWKVSGPQEITTYFSNAIRGNNQNDIVVAGAFGEIVHYNGSSWKSFLTQTAMANGTFYSVAFKGSIIVSVGQVGNRAVVAKGKRIE